MAQPITTKISKGYQTVVPAEVRARFRGEPGDEIIWSIIGDQVYIRIKPKTGIDPLLKFVGKFSTKESIDATKELDETVYDGK